MKDPITQKYGKLHPTLQQFDRVSPLHVGHADAYYMGGTVDPGNIRTWFGNGHQPAFHTPPGNDQGLLQAEGKQESYPCLTYHQLHEQMNQCPPWRTLLSPSQMGDASAATLVVGILLPSDLMAEVAVVHLCIMSGGGGSPGNISSCCSAPLDPRSSRQNLLLAMDQMKCKGLVTSRDMMEKFDLEFLLAKTEGSSPLEKSIAGRMADVRVIRSERNGNGRRDGSVIWDVLRQDNEAVEAESLHGNYDGEGNCKVVKVSAAINANPHSHPPLLLLRTSGTTSVPKLVPLTGPQLLYNAKCQINAMDLTSKDVTLNAMPLFHIGGLSCSFFAVLVSGGSAIYCGAFDPERFIKQICGWHGTQSSGKGDRLQTSSTLVKPTWYNAVPTMHQAILFHSKSSTEYADALRTQNSLRFIRSGAANLSWEVASDLKMTFDTQVINSFALSECMPVCVQPIGSDFEDNASDASGPPVGVPVGPSLRIANPNTGEALPYGSEGEICISGPGVIAAYPNAPPSQTHTSDGWLRTGDVGQIDPTTHQIVITGRSKEMIKRGGEQVWPTTVDGIVEAIDGVKICVTFGVNNTLWGQEVAAAVVLEEGKDENIMENTILSTCERELDNNAVPAQIVFVQAKDIPKGPSGKYLRLQMAKTLRVEAVDTGALQSMQAFQLQTDAAESAGEKIFQPRPSNRVRASASIDGIRIIASIFVVMNHVGFYPTLFLEKLARFNISIPIFFILAAFQLSLSLVGEIKWSTFVGTRIGNLHSLFLITQIIALPSFLIFECAGDNTGSCDGSFYVKQILTWAFSSLTGMFGVYNFSNPPSWFLTVIYQFMIIFPFLDKWARARREKAQSAMFAIFILLSTFASVAIFFGETPDLHVNKLRWSIIAFFPTLFASMLCAYFFIRSNQQAYKQNERKAALKWAVITDVTSLSLLAICILVAFSDCVWLTESTVSVMRPGQPLSEMAASLWSRMPARLSFERRQGYGQLTESSLVQVCNVAYSEFVDFLHDSPLTPTNGRYPTTLGLYIGRLRMGTPIAMLWIYGLAKGHGLTAKLMRFRPLLWISPLTYHLYLLHVPVARLYWLITREGALTNRKFWFSRTPTYPFPIQWWEVIVLVVMCLVLGAAIDQFITPILQPHTVRCGNWICEKLSSFFSPAMPSSNTTKGRGSLNTCDNTEDLIKEKIRGLTGASGVTRVTNLSELGLDSLGTTALLSVIRSATHLAENLTVQDLISLKTVGELVDFIEGSTADEELGYTIRA